MHLITGLVGWVVWGQSLLYYASQHGLVDIVDALVFNGATHKLSREHLQDIIQEVRFAKKDLHRFDLRQEANPIDRFLNRRLSRQDEDFCC